MGKRQCGAVLRERVAELTAAVQRLGEAAQRRQVFGSAAEQTLAATINAIKLRRVRVRRIRGVSAKGAMRRNSLSKITLIFW